MRACRWIISPWTGATNSPSVLWCKPINTNRDRMESQQAHNGQLKGGAGSLCCFSLCKTASVSPRQWPATGVLPSLHVGQVRKQRGLPPVGRGQCVCCHWVGTVQFHMQNKSSPGRPGTPAPSLCHPDTGNYWKKFQGKEILASSSQGAQFSSYRESGAWI